MKIQSKNKLYKLLKFICLYMFFSNMVIAQEEVAEDNVPIIDTAFPIAVVNMQAIVGQSLAAVKVKEFTENKKVEFTTEIQKEEQELKSMQEELGSQRSILPPDEFEDDGPLESPVTFIFI